jgi:hypothetical protein
VQGSVGIFQIAGGKVKELRLVWGNYALMQQIGALADQSTL